MSNRAREVEQEFDQLAAAGEYEQALDLVTREAHLFPYHAQKVVYSWRMWMACKLNRMDLALQLLREAVDAGHWYSTLASDSDFEPVWGDPEFKRLVEICAARRAEAMANARWVMETRRPAGAGPFPLLVALHGANGTAAEFAGHWEAAVAHGWLVGVPQSSQEFGPGTFSWNDGEWSERDVRRAFETLQTEHSVDVGRVALAGFSQGGGLAVRLALAGATPARGLILVNPFLAEVESIIPALAARQSALRGLGPLRAYIVVGQHDRYCYGVAKQLAELFPRYGIPCTLDEYPDLEHNFPEGFDGRLPEALEYVMQG